MRRLVTKRAVAGLCTMPPEIVDQILSDLTVDQILRVAKHKVPYIHQCILSNKTWGFWFEQSLEELLLLCDYFRLWNIIRISVGESTEYYWIKNKYRGSNDQVYSKDAQRIPLYDRFPPYRNSNGPSRYRMHGAKYTRRRLHSNIFQILNLTPLEISILAPYAVPAGLHEVWDSSTLAKLQSRWDIIKCAQQKLSAEKAQQIQHAAELLEQNSDILHRVRDPEQVRRPKLEHIVNQMKRDARRIAKESPRNHKHVNYFADLSLPVVPLHEVLDFVLEMLKKHTASRDLYLIAEKQVSQTHNNGSPSIIDDVETVLQGLDYIYLRPEQFEEDHPVPRISRVEFLRWKSPLVHAKPSEHAEISFRGSEISLANRYIPRRAQQQHPISPAKRYLPHDEREIKWTEAFIRLYRYFKGIETKSC